MSFLREVLAVLANARKSMRPRPLFYRTSGAKPV